MNNLSRRLEVVPPSPAKLGFWIAFWFFAIFVLGPIALWIIVTFVLGFLRGLGVTA